MSERYQIRRENTEHGDAVLLQDTARNAEATVYPELGNNCVAFRTTPDGDETTSEVEVLLPPDNISELRSVPFTGGLPILFPFPNRVRGGRFEFQGRSCFMERLLNTGWDRGAGQAIHGLVADREWTVEETRGGEHSAEMTASLRLDAFPDILAQYPFPCTITVTYRVIDGRLEMHTRVRNTGGADLPMGFGIHPWFPAALRPGARLPQAVAHISKEERARFEAHIPADGIWQLQDLMPTGVVESFDRAGQQYDLRGHRPLAASFYDNVFTRVQHEADGSSESALRDPASGLEMYMRADSGFREWVLYAPLERAVTALEPYTCTTDAVNLEPQGIDAGLITLAPGAEWTGDIVIGLRRNRTDGISSAV